MKSIVGFPALLIAFLKGCSIFKELLELDLVFHQKKATYRLMLFDGRQYLHCMQFSSLKTISLVYQSRSGEGYRNNFVSFQASAFL